MTESVKRISKRPRSVPGFIFSAVTSVSRNFTANYLKLFFRGPLDRKPGIFITWLPLAVMWNLMAIEQPVITAAIARMSNATGQLAAFGIAFSMALLIESLVVQMLATGTAVADNRENYKRLLMMMHIIGGGATIIHATLCIPVVFNAFATMVLGIPRELIIPSRMTFLVLLPWTIGIGYRRLWQGVLIRYSRTKMIPVAMVLRILFIVITSLWAIKSQRISGSVAGGLSLSVGIAVSFLVTWLCVRPVVKNLPSAMDQSDKSIMSWKDILGFYIPLALTSVINLGVRPVLQMGLARGVLPLESMAVWPVFAGYMFLFHSLALASQEVVIARLDSPESQRQIIRFSIILASVLSIASILAFSTPFWKIWYSGISGLEDSLTSLSHFPTILISPMIPLSVFISLCHGALIRQRRTREVTCSIAINITVLISIMLAGIAIFPYPAISIVAVSHSLAFAVELVYLASRHPLSNQIQHNG